LNPAGSTEGLRFAVRQFASGVAVLTVAHGGRVQGTTVSAMTAVSRQPLLIGACLRPESVFMRLVGDRRRFAVNVLTARQAQLAGWFADPERPSGPAQFGCVDWEPDPFSGAPLISGSLARLGCRLTASIPVGDHHLLLAEVVSGSTEEGSPLLSFAGRLHDGLLRRLPPGPAHPAAPPRDAASGVVASSSSAVPSRDAAPAVRDVRKAVAVGPATPSTTGRGVQ